jgi:predicted TIM-barrel fold metal-dependent hydrolase
MNLTRRRFFYVTAAFAAAAGAGSLLPFITKRRPLRNPDPIIDCHVHLFGAGDAPGLAENERCFLSTTQRKHWTYSYLLRLLKIRPDGQLDNPYVERLVAQLRASSLARVLLLAQDARYDAEGRLDLQRTTSIYVPNRYLFRVVKQNPDSFLPCPSINPKRRDALDELGYCYEEGARVLKIHPPTQDVDPGEPRFRPFFRRCAELGVTVMVHTGTEHSAEIVGDEYSDPSRLTLALDEGCRAVACHAGKLAFFDKADFYPRLVSMMQRYSNLYCDTAVLGSMFRWRCLPQMLESELVMSRTIHGSDYPFPSNALVFWRRLGWSELFRLITEKNLLERDLRLKRALGLPLSTFSLGAKLFSPAKPQGIHKRTWPLWNSDFA